MILSANPVVSRFSLFIFPFLSMNVFIELLLLIPKLTSLCLGLDYGGVGREWVDLLCTAIFDPFATGMFTSFVENSQGLV